MSTEQILLNTAKEAARKETINYLYPEATDRPDAAFTVARFKSANLNRERLLPDHEFITDSGNFFSPLFSADIYNVAPVFLAAANGHTAFLKEDARGLVPSESSSPSLEEVFLPDDDWDEPQAAISETFTSSETMKWEGDKVYLGLLPGNSGGEEIQNLFLRISGLPAEVSERLSNVPVFVGRYPVRLEALEDVADLTNSQQPLGNEAMTIYHKKKRTLSMLAREFFCLSELPSDRVGEPESYPDFVREQMTRHPLLIVLTLHLRPRQISATAFENCQVDINVLPVWNARRASINLKAGDQYRLKTSPNEQFLGVLNVHRSDGLRLKEATGSMPEGTYRVYSPEPSNELLKALSRQLTTLDATIKELNANVGLLDEASDHLSVDVLNDLSAVLHTAATRLEQAGVGAPDKERRILAVAPGPVDHNYFIDYLVSQNIPPLTVITGTKLRPVTTSPGGSPAINNFSATLVSEVTVSAIPAPDFMARKAFVKDLFSVRKNSTDGIV